MTNELPPPDVLALLICDQIISDRMTGKQSLIGMFSRIHSRRFPAIHPQLCVFVALTEGHGKTDLTIRLVDGNESRPPLVEGRGSVDFKDPRAVANLALQFHGLRFPTPGEYRVQLWSGGALLRQARLQLVQVDTPPQAGGGGGGMGGGDLPPPEEHPAF
jgi:hypothetical protein